MTENKIPAGSLPPEKDTVEDAAPVEEPRVYAGKYNTPEDLENGYTELFKKIGSQSGEVNEVRAQNKVLTEQLERMQTESKQQVNEALNTQPPTDFEQQLADVAKQYDDGDMTFAEAMRQTTAITAQQAQTQAQSEIQKAMEQTTNSFQEELQRRDQQKVVDQFHRDNPDFLEMQKSGAFEKIKAENPLFDDLNAYQHLQMQQKIEEAKAEQARVASGSEAASKVLTKPGQSIQQQNKPNKPMTEAERKASMLAALE